MRVIDRRLFLNESALLATTAAILGQSATATAAKPAAAKKAGDKLRVAVIGVGGRGKDHLGGFAGRLGCEVTVVCDADKAFAKKAIEIVKAKQDKEPTFEQDVRKVVTNKDIDIISIATPNHWHSLMAIWGLQNGKHVYVEKPVSHNVVEGRRIVQFAHGKGLVCQTGTQSRSSKGMRDAMAFLKSGKLGKVKVAKGLCYKLRGSIGLTKGPQKVPGTVNYDLWCGPASNAPLRRKRLHYDWHWVWEYGNGDLGNQGIHEMDKARWGLGKEGLPNSVQSIGGRFGYVDDGQTANTQIIHFDYGDSALVFEVRGLRSISPYPGSRSPKTPGADAKPTNFVGNIYYCADGFLVCPSYSGGVAYSKDGEIIKTFGGGGDHYGNFVSAVRAGKRDGLNADILEGHLSSAMCHLGNISYRLGSKAAFDPKGSPFGDKTADAAFGNMVKHLSDNGVKVEETKFSKGPRLKLDPKTERFIGTGPDDTKANKMLVREEYRKGFELPDATKG
jgi:predicted dehydrogenase